MTLDWMPAGPPPADARPAGWRGSVGVLGGMGPMAGASFVCRLTELTPAPCDQAHLPVLLLSDPRIPDRSAARLAGGPDPFPAMREGLRFLERQGVDCIAVPCNTAHLWFDALQESLAVPILHIVDAVIADLGRQGVHEGPVGLMGTAATLALGLYQQPLRQAGYLPILPDEHEIQAFSVAAIEAVKGNRLAEARTHAARGIESLTRRGARAVVLGCTELPLAVPHGCRGEFGAVLTDSIDALARAVIARMQVTGRALSVRGPGLIPDGCFEALACD